MSMLRPLTPCAAVCR